MSDIAFFDNVWRNFDPLAPLSPEDPDLWYEDLSGARGESGGGGLVHRIVRRIRKDATRPQRLLVLGHAGCGKSTELNRVHRLLERDGYVCVDVAVDRDLDKEDLELPEILVLIVERVGAVLEATKVPLDDALFRRVAAWFQEEVTTTSAAAGTSAGVKVSTDTALKDLFLGLLPSITADARVSAERRSEIRQKVQRRLRDFLDMVRELLEAADKGLAARSGKGLVLLVDGLEKAGHDDQGRGRASRILLDQSEQWALLPVPLVLAAPLALLREQVKINNHYDEFYLVPAVPVSARPGGGGQSPPDYVVAGRTRLRSLVEKRCPLFHLFEEVADFELLLTRSGGNLRDLFRLLRSALDDTPEGQKIPRAAVDSAIKRAAIQVRSVLQAEDREPMKRLLLDPEAFHYDQAGVGLLQRELVMPYVNGGTWFGVHPALQALLQR